ncbi:MAG: nitrogen fixation protein NifH [Anaerolineae bacterium]
MGTNGNNVIEWLLEEDNPSVKYWSLRNLLDYREDDFLVRSARHKIMQVGAVPNILSRLNEAGHYEDETTIQEYGPERAGYGYLPKYRGTVWQLLLFSDLAADPDDERVRRTCEYVLEHSWEPSGLFSMVGNQYLAPCFQGNMVYALTRLGYGDDPRVVKAREVLVEYTRFDDGGFATPKVFPYRATRDRCCGAHSCYAGCLKALKAITALAPERWDQPTRDFVQRGAEYFLAHRVYHASHSPDKLLHKEIDEITFPSFVYGDFLEILITLLELGVKDERMQDAMDLLQAKQLPNGRWRLERDVSTMHVALGRKHRESKWATYRARYALKKWQEAQ